MGSPLSRLQEQYDEAVSYICDIFDEYMMLLPMIHSVVPLLAFILRCFFYIATANITEPSCVVYLLTLL